MVLVMVEGHLGDTLLSPEARAEPLYVFQQIFHGSTAPGFLFASGFVAGLPRAPLSPRAALRRARRLLFILGVGYALHLPYLSLWKSLAAATPAEAAAFWACHALQVIAVTQLLALALQALFGPRWTAVAGVLTLVLLAAGPAVWASSLSARVPPALGAYLDTRLGSSFPVFPYSAFVLGGAVAGAALGRQEYDRRRRRALAGAVGFLGAGVGLAVLLSGRVEFWGVSPAYALLRLGGLLLLLRVVEEAARRGLPGVSTLALFGHETLLVYVLHLYFLYGGVVGPAPLGPWASRLGFGEAALAVVIAALLAAAWAWHRVKVRAPHEARLGLTFATVAFVYAFATRPW